MQESNPNQGAVYFPETDRVVIEFQEELLRYYFANSKAQEAKEVAVKAAQDAAAIGYEFNQKYWNLPEVFSFGHGGNTYRVEMSTDDGGIISMVQEPSIAQLIKDSERMENY